VHPVALARAAITLEEEEGLAANIDVLAEDRALIAQSLERVGGVDEDDYHRLAVRWEVIEQAIAVLEGAAQSRGQAGRRFSREVYEAALGAPTVGPPS
jgi:hypothetical protein